MIFLLFSFFVLADQASQTPPSLAQTQEESSHSAQEESSDSATADSSKAVEKSKDDRPEESSDTATQAQEESSKPSSTQDKKKSLDGIENRALAEEQSLIENRSPSAKKVKKIRIKRDSRFKMPQSKATTKKKKAPINLQLIQPPSSIQFYYPPGSDEAELEQVMIAEERQLFKLLKDRKDADLILRLASLYVDRSRLISFKIQNDYNLKMEQYKKGNRPTKPYLNLKPAQVYNQKSLKLFEGFKRNYPNHKRMDEVLFFLGFNFYQLANKKQGIQYYEELVNRFPKSFYVYETRFQLGEHYFQLKKWQSSLRYYSMVSKNKTGKFYFFSLYKMAWCLYKLNKISQGLLLLERIIKESGRFQQRSDRSQMVTFADEAVQDLTLFYTYSKRLPQSARSFFINLLGPDKAWPLLKKLAYAYRDTGQTRGLVILFQNLIDHNPSGKSAFDYKFQIVESIYNTGRVSDIIQITKEWVDNYGPGSTWAIANQQNRNLLQKAFTLQEVTIRNFALKNHQTYRKTKSPQSKTLAVNLYKFYFKVFTNSEFSDQMYFWYAEILFDSKQYISAVKAYEGVISKFPNSKYAKASYLNQVLALEKALPGEKEIRQMVGTGEDPVEMPSVIKSFIKIANRYVSQFPRAENSPTILYKMAGLAYRFNQYDMSVAYFKKMFEQYSTHSLAGNVGSILLDIYSKNKDYKSLEALAVQLSQTSKNAELLKEARSILEQISFKRAQDLALNKQYKESAVLYEKFAKSNPGSPLAPSAFYNAGLNFVNAKDSLQALSMYSSVITYKTKAHADIRKKSREFIAVLYEKLGFYKKAADAYVAFAKAYPTESKSADFWYNAGVIFDALNDVGSAIYSYNKYYTLSKKKDRYDVYYLIAVLYEKNRKWTQAIQYYDKFLKTPSSKALRVMLASFSVADIYETQLKNLNLAKTWHQKTLSLYRRLKVGVSYGARSHFYIVKKDYYEPFAKLKIPLDANKQKAVITKKIQLLQNLEKALKPIIRYNEGETILASLVLIGMANEEFARQIYASPVPKGLDKEGVKKYKAGILTVVQPYIKKSVEHYRLAIQRSIEIQVYSESIGKAYKALAGIQMSKGQFVRFLPVSLFQQTFSIVLEDDTDTVKSGMFSGVQKSLKYGLSASDFESLFRALNSRDEKQVLSAVSAILNKDPENTLAINTLAFFYLKKNQLGLAQFILSRLSTKNQKNEVILNNLAVVSLKYGKNRPAIAFLKKALEIKPSYKLAKVNLGNIFIQKYDYQNAYKYYEKNYMDIINNKKGINRKNTLSLLNNYSIALTGAQQWMKAGFVFKNLVKSSSPSTESLFNYSCFLAEKSKREKLAEREKTLAEAKDLVDELKTYSLTAGLRKKLNRLSRNIKEAQAKK